MDKKLYPRIGEEVIWETLDNGLPVCIVPKQGFSRKYALFATRYGGMDMRFELNGQWLDTPAGIAHYLEHKMFDTKDGNALQELAKNGAEPNAFTSNAITCYYFDSTEKFYENLEILLSFVSVPYFTDESVEKEQGIIGQEIGMIEEQHVTQYGALLDPGMTWLENLLLHEYTECYLYWSCVEDETDLHIKKIWEQHFEQECSHLHAAEALLKQYEGKEACQIIPDGTFPELLRFGPQKEYLRKVLKTTILNTAVQDDPAIPVETLTKDAPYYAYQAAVCPDAARVASHQVIEEHIGTSGKDYRFEEKPHPVEALRDRTKDNTTIARGKI